MTDDPMPAPMSREQYYRRVMASMFGTPEGETAPMLAHDAALRAALAAAETRAAQLEDGLRAVWESVPATYDGRDPLVQRHAAALNAIPALLAPRPETPPQETP